MTAPVVVGASATSGSPAALAWGREQAERLGAPLIVVRAWRLAAPAASTSGAATRVQTSTDAETAARAALEADVAAALGSDHGAELRLVRGSTRRVLLDAAEGAALLVIDAPRTLSAAPLFAHRLVYAAACPVVVMPPRIASPEGGVVQRAGRAVGRAAVRSAGTAGRPGYRPPPTSN